MKIAREALPFALPLVVAAAAAGAFGVIWLCAVCVALLLFVLWFFRDPRRRFDGPPDLVLAPADGTVLEIEKVHDPAYGRLSGGDGEVLRIVTFLSVFNVHIQRCPTEGTVVGSERKSGRFVAAFRADAHEVNEAHLTVLRRDEGDLIGVWQIVGLVARRIVPYLDIGHRVERGEHLGLIKFGSRVDLLLPADYEPLVETGAKVKAGFTPMAMPTDPSSRPVTEQRSLPNPSVHSE